MFHCNLSEEDNFHSFDVAAGSAGIGHNCGLLAQISEYNFSEYGQLVHTYNKWVDLLAFVVSPVPSDLADFAELSP